MILISHILGEVLDHCATPRTAADLIGASADIGSIQAGRYADIIAVKADPLKDVRALERIDFVMKGGTTVKANGKAF